MMRRFLHASMGTAFKTPAPDQLRTDVRQRREEDVAKCFLHSFCSPSQTSLLKTVLFEVFSSIRPSSFRPCFVGFFNIYFFYWRNAEFF